MTAPAPLYLNQPEIICKKSPVLEDKGTSCLKVHRNAVLPQFLTWETQVGTLTLILSFRVQARFTAIRIARSLYS